MINKNNYLIITEIKEIANIIHFKSLKPEPIF